MASFLDDPNARQQALYQGLLMAGPALLAAASPSTQPGGLGRGFAAFGQNLGQGYRAGINDARTGAMANIQMQMLKEKMAEQERARKALESMYPQAQTPQTNFDTPPSAVSGQPSPIPSLMSGAPGITPQILQGLPAQEALKLLATSGMKQAETAQNRQFELGKMGVQNELAQKLKLAPGWEKPESPIEQELKKTKLEKDKLDVETTKRTQGETIASIDRTIRTGKELMAHPGGEAGTGASYLLGKIPGTSARDFSATLDAFKSQNFLPAVQALKGLGQLSDAEGRKLEAAVGALDPGMSEGEFKKSLQAIISDLEAARRRMPGTLSPPQPTGWSITRVE